SLVPERPAVQIHPPMDKRNKKRELKAKKRELKAKEQKKMAARQALERAQRASQVRSPTEIADGAVDTAKVPNMTGRPSGYEPASGNEISPGMRSNGEPISGDEYLEYDGTGAPWAYEVRRQKREGTRPKPSALFETIGSDPASGVRGALLDKVAELVDE